MVSPGKYCSVNNCCFILSVSSFPEHIITLFAVFIYVKISDGCNDPREARNMKDLTTLCTQVQYVLVSKHPLWGLARFLVYRIRTIYNGRNNYIYLHNRHANLMTVHVCIMYKTPVMPTQHSLPTSSWVRTKQKHTHGSLNC